jgi:hypothetical protein
VCGLPAPFARSASARFAAAAAFASSCFAAR